MPPSLKIVNIIVRLQLYKLEPVIYKDEDRLCLGFSQDDCEKGLRNVCNAIYQL